IDKSFNQFPSQGIANHKAANADDVHIVVFHPLMGGKVVMYQRGTDTGNLVCDHACSHTAAAKGNAPFQITPGHGLCQWNDEIGVIVSRVQLKGSKIGHLMTSGIENRCYPCFQSESDMVGCNPDSHHMLSFWLPG